MTTSRISRRAALKSLAASAFAAPFVWRNHVNAAPSETVYHASFGAGGMAGSDIGSLTASKNLKLVAVADVDLSHVADIKKRFPDVKVYQDWRELLDKEKNLNSVNVSTPDHMHGSITMRAMQQGLHVYTQKPLTQTIYEARQLTKMAAEKKLVTQMGIQIHSHVESIARWSPPSRPGRSARSRKCIAGAARIGATRIRAPIARIRSRPA